MKIVAIGPTEALLGLMLAGVTERLETAKPDEALRYLSELSGREKSCMVIISSSVFGKIKSEIADLEEKLRMFVFYEMIGGELRWRERT